PYMAASGGSLSEMITRVRPFGVGPDGVSVPARTLGSVYSPRSRFTGRKVAVAAGTTVSAASEKRMKVRRKAAQCSRKSIKSSDGLRGKDRTGSRRRQQALDRLGDRATARRRRREARVHVPGREDRGERSGARVGGREPARHGVRRSCRQ